MKTSTPEKIVILGAGLVGSLWAHLLTQKGYTVDVFEKRPHPDLEKAPQGRSINLVITSRGVHGLKVAGLQDQILPITVPVYGRDIHSLKGDRVFQPYGRDKSECNYSVSRWDLNRALTRLLLKKNTPCHFEHELESIDLDLKKLVFKTPQGLKTVQYDRVFATDGAGSVIRKAMVAKNSAVYQESVEWLGSDYKELAIHESTMFDKNSLHIWPRGTHMMMGLASVDGSMTMTCYLPRENHEFSFANLKTKADVHAFFESQFADSVRHIPNLEDQFLANPQGRLATVRMSHWNYKDQIVLMGDAAHAIVPFFGQGMNLGFEDCTTLIQLIENASPKTSSDWSDVFKNFDELQRPNANAIATMALENFIEMRDKVGQPDFQAMKKIESIIEKSYPELYRSRYGLITYTLTPYRLAFEAGQIQQKLLSDIYSDLSSKKLKPEDLVVEIYKSQIESRMTDWFKKNSISLNTYRA